MQEQIYSVLHLFSGIGGAAIGFHDAQVEWRGLRGSFVTLAGIDCDPEACADFKALTGAPAVQMDLFSRDDYRAFHGQETPADWREATPEDIRTATGGIAPDVVFLSPPCKGFSGLLPSGKARSAKYQALNRLVPRGLQLVMDAFADDLPAVIMIENVPRITSRGADLLRDVKQLLRHHGYAIHPADDRDGYHDCGELGGLGQRRKRYLLIARNTEKVLPFIYRPPLKRVKTIGEVLEHLPMPDDPTVGPMHRLPRLQWKTWVRIALIPAGGDWRDLEKIASEQYRLEHVPRRGAFGVQDWDGPAGTVTAADGPNNAAVSVADPRCEHYNHSFRITGWNKTAGTVTGGCAPSNGAICVADPRISCSPWDGVYKVQKWDEHSKTVTGTSRVYASNGAAMVADPRLPERGNRHPAVYRVVKWDEAAPCVTGTRFGSGAPGVVDPRVPADSDRPDLPPIIIALDGTWHRPLTTLELAILQGFSVYMPDGRPLQLTGKSDARWRERIGNAVPPAAAQAAAESILGALLRHSVGFWMCDQANTDVWVRRGDRNLTRKPAP